MAIDIEEGKAIVSVGRSAPIPAGQATADNSVPVVIASDQSPVPILDNLSAPSEVRDDMLGIPRVQTPLAIFDDTNILDIDPQKWSWLENTANGYSSVTHLPLESGAQLLVNTSAPNGHVCQLQTRLVFPYQTGRITVASFGVSTLANNNATLEWGMFDGGDGYFVRLVGSQLYFVRRTSSGETPQIHGAAAGALSHTVGNTTYKLISAPGDPAVMEEIVSRAGFTGDPLDGSVQGTAGTHTISFSNVCMWRIEYGWYGGTGARLFAYVPIDENLPQGEVARYSRWVLLHQLNVSDRIPFPSLGNPNLPMTFRVQKTGNLPSAVFLKKYGAQVTIDGGEAKKLDIYSAESPAVSVGTAALRPLLTIRMKDVIINNQATSKRNNLRVLPISLGISSLYRARFVLIKNVTGLSLDAAAINLNGSSEWTSPNALSAVDVNTTANTATGGTIIGTFFSGDDDGQTIDLTEIFQIDRMFLARELQLGDGVRGDNLTLAVQSLNNANNICKASLIWGQR